MAQPKKLKERKNSEKNNVGVIPLYTLDVGSSMMKVDPYERFRQGPVAQHKVSGFGA